MVDNSFRIGERFENCDNILLGIGAEERVAAMIFLDQYDPNRERPTNGLPTWTARRGLRWPGSDGLSGLTSEIPNLSQPGLTRR